MVSKDENITPPNPTPLHGEGMDRLFQMQKDLGKLEAESSATIKALGRIENKLGKHDDILKTIKITTVITLSLVTIAVLFIKLYEKLPPT